jgi:hypothetical protein
MTGERKSIGDSAKDGIIASLRGTGEIFDAAIGGVKVVLREPSRGEAGGHEPRAG